MADVVYSFGSAKYSDDAKTCCKKNSVKQIFLKILIVFIVVLFFVEVISYLLVLPARSNAIVYVDGCETLTLYEIKKIAGLSDQTKWLGINSSVISRLLISSPLIASATVEKKFPDKVLIKITERKAVAISFVEINDVTVPVEIDKEGVVFRIGSNYISKNLPIITGLTFSSLRAGIQVNKQLSDLFMQLDVLERNHSVLLNEISEIKIRPRKYGGYDLVLYPVKSCFSLITNKLLTEDTLRYMILLIDVARETGLDKTVVELDIRGSSAVYTKRGENNE